MDLISTCLLELITLRLLNTAKIEVSNKNDDFLRFSDKIVKCVLNHTLEYKYFAGLYSIKFIQCAPILIQVYIA